MAPVDWLWALLLPFGEAAVAYITLDLFLRRISVEATGLQQRLRRAARLYYGIGACGVAAGAWLQWRLLGPIGLALIPLDGLPWWLLWRFGLRKQFTYLFKP